MDKPTFDELWKRFNAAMPYGDNLNDEQLTVVHLITKHYPDRAEKILRKRIKQKHSELRPIPVITINPGDKIIQKRVWM